MPGLLEKRVIFFVSNNIDGILSFLLDALSLSIISGGKLCCIKHARLQTITSQCNITDKVLTCAAVILLRHNPQQHIDTHVLTFHLMQTPPGWASAGDWGSSLLRETASLGKLGMCYNRYWVCYCTSRRERGSVFRCAWGGCWCGCLFVFPGDTGCYQSLDFWGLEESPATFRQWS